MRLAYLSASIVPSRNANSVHVMNMSAALARAGHDVTLYARRGEPGDPYAIYAVQGFNLHLFPQWPIPGLRAVAYSAAVRKALARDRAEVLYARHLPSLLAARKTGALLIYEAHTPPANALYRRLELALFRSDRFARLVVISSSLAGWYRANAAIHPDKILVAHDAANDVAAYQARALPEVRTKRFSVGYIGQLYRGKGMEIISRLPELLPDVDFHVVGGTESDITYWRAQSSATNLKLHGYVPHGRLHTFMSQFDMVLAPYQRVVSGSGKQRDISSWMSPLKIFEYMAAGMPMIVSDLPVLKEILQHEDNALLVPPDDVRAWAAAIRRGIEEPDLSAAIGMRARHSFLSGHSWDARARMVLEGI